jgi:glycosyltransferase involved in cell wall biosynthesis
MVDIQNRQETSEVLSRSTSVVIPLYNEEQSLQELYSEITSAFDRLPVGYEILFINDGSSDGSQRVLEKIVASDTSNHVRVVQLKRNFGKATALNVGFSIAKGGVVITMDADLQDDPKEIPRFLEKIEEGYDVVSGWKVDRKDSFIKNNTSKVYNYFTSLFGGVKLHDHNCGFKAYRREAVEGLELYGQLHRFVPVLVAANGYTRITEIDVNHRKRSFGKTKYGLNRFLHGFLDLLTVFFITKYKSKPLHFFGVIGLWFFGIGVLISLYLSYLRLVENAVIGSRPLLFLAVLLIVVGVQIGTIGLISEQITHSGKRDRDVVVRKIVG